MKDWWHDRAPRERSILSLAGVILIILIIYLIIWLPISDHVSTLKRRTADNQTLLVWMQAANKAIRTHQNEQAPPHITSPSERLEVIQNSLAQVHFKKSVSQLAQTEHNDVRIQISKASFDEVMTWLVELWQAHGIIVSELTIRHLTDQGIVSANIILTGKK